MPTIYHIFVHIQYRFHHIITFSDSLKRFDPSALLEREEIVCTHFKVFEFLKSRQKLVLMSNFLAIVFIIFLGSGRIWAIGQKCNDLKVESVTGELECNVVSTIEKTAEYGISEEECRDPEILEKKAKRYKSM